jgi:hypothetical protein
MAARCVLPVRAWISTFSSLEQGFARALDSHGAMIAVGNPELK